MPYCENCGKEYKPGAKFCEECGVNLNETISGNDVNAPIEKPLAPVNIDINSEHFSSIENKTGEEIQNKQIPNKKSYLKNNKKYIFIIIFSIIIILLAITFLINKSKNTSTSNISISNSSLKIKVNKTNTTTIPTINNKDIKNNNYYNFTLKDNNNVENDINIYSNDAKEEKTTSENMWAGASEGDKIITGHFKISYKKTSEKEMTVDDLKDYVLTTNNNIITLNVTRKLVSVIKNKYSDQPDFLFIGRPEASMCSSVQVYYIKNGKLQIISYKYENENNNYISICNSMTLFFKQVNKDEFETSSYVNGIYYINTLKFNNNIGVLQYKNSRKMSIDEYNTYTSK